MVYLTHAEAEASKEISRRFGRRGSRRGQTARLHLDEHAGRLSRRNPSSHDSSLQSPCSDSAAAGPSSSSNRRSLAANQCESTGHIVAKEFPSVFHPLPSMNPWMKTMIDRQLHGAMHPSAASSN
jgi:hypothetical protein